MVGYMDANYYYLLPELAFGEVVHFYKAQERSFPLRRAATYKMLREEGIIEVGRDGKTTRPKRTPEGKVQRMMWIPRWHLDGGDAPQKQVKMESPAAGGDGFTEVPMGDVPEKLC